LHVPRKEQMISHSHSNMQGNHYIHKASYSKNPQTKVYDEDPKKLP